MEEIGNFPKVDNRETVGPVKGTDRVIEFEAALCYRNGSQNGALVIDHADPLTCTIHVPRPGIRRRHLEAARKPAIHPPLHGVVGRISLASPNEPSTEVGIKIL